jgi:catechol 2,3-dioxygenase-like lactoylglutathione lyase family enzyme
MAFRHLLAQAVVTDLAAAERWYTALFDSAPQARPMDGLLEWHLGDSFGVQVWLDPARAGRSALVLDESDLDALAVRLSAAGLHHDGPQPVTASRVLVLADPDGNQVVVTGT